MAPAAKKRVLIVDDAVVVRKTVSDAIAQDPALEVAGTAANGKLALAKFASLKPDIVLLDIEMPEMDGLETVRELRKIDARIPIVMFSTLTERGASATLEALSLGATDYVTKPSNSDMTATLDAVARELVPRIRALCRVPIQIRPAKTELAEAARPPVLLKAAVWAPPKIIAIGVSTGGPDALAHVIPMLPRDLPVPVVIAQHMPPIFTTLLAERLGAKSAVKVRECVSGDVLAPGCAFLAPGDQHMEVCRENDTIRLRTQQGPKENFCRPSVDVLFRSVAAVYGGRTLAVIMTGMGQDGLKGCELLSGTGARIMVQDEATSVVWGMPGFVARAGLADSIVPLNHLSSEIVRALTPPKAAPRAAGTKAGG